MFETIIQNKLALIGLACLAAALILSLIALITGRLKAKRVTPEKKQAQTGEAFRPTLRLRSINLGTQRIVVIDRVDFLIGSGAECNLVLDNDKTISHEHCRILYKNFKHYIIDLDSKNHTYLNGKIVPAMKECEITIGDSLSFSYSFDFVVESAFKE